MCLPGRYRDLFVCGRFLALATLHGGAIRLFG